MEWVLLAANVENVHRIGRDYIDLMYLYLTFNRSSSPYMAVDGARQLYTPSLKIVGKLITYFAPDLCKASQLFDFYLCSACKYRATGNLSNFNPGKFYQKLQKY